MIYVLGVAGGRSAIELYGVNHAWEVTMHGWFNTQSGCSVLQNRPPCFIVADYGALSEDAVDSLREAGHTVMVMPAAGLPSRSRFRRSAKDVCRLAQGLAEASPRAMAH